MQLPDAHHTQTHTQGSARMPSCVLSAYVIIGICCLECLGSIGLRTSDKNGRARARAKPLATGFEAGGQKQPGDNTRCQLQLASRQQIAEFICIHMCQSNSWKSCCVLVLEACNCRSVSMCSSNLNAIKSIRFHCNHVRCTWAVVAVSGCGGCVMSHIINRFTIDLHTVRSPAALVWNRKCLSSLKLYSHSMLHTILVLLYILRPKILAEHIFCAIEG